MATVQLRLGPADHGRPVSADELDAADYQPGHRYEVIDGRLYVSPLPNAPEHWLEMWLRDRLTDYGRAVPERDARVATKARVFVPDRPDLTVPEPDLALYQPFPVSVPPRELRWQEMTPLVVAEVLVEGDAHKDLVRNVELYFQVPGIAEYWILDGRDDPGQPVLVARRRFRGRWLLHEVPPGETYTTPTLPGFELSIDPQV